MRNTLFSQVKETKAEPTLEQIEERKLEDLEQTRKNRAYAKQWEEAESAKERLEQDRWLQHTQGRPLPQQGEVFFSEPGECDICKASVVRPLSGYNPWRGQFDVNLDYNVEDHTRHTCRSEDPKIMNQYLSTKILQLEDRVRRQQAELDDVNNLSYVRLARNFKAR